MGVASREAKLALQAPCGHGEMGCPPGGHLLPLFCVSCRDSGSTFTARVGCISQGPVHKQVSLVVPTPRVLWVTAQPLAPSPPQHQDTHPPRVRAPSPCRPTVILHRVTESLWGLMRHPITKPHGGPFFSFSQGWDLGKAREAASSGPKLKGVPQSSP